VASRFVSLWMLIWSLQGSFQEHPKYGAKALREVVSPFAAIVFDRCEGDRSRLVREVEKLRKELKATGQTLATLEWDALWGPRDDSLKAGAQGRGDVKLSPPARSQPNRGPCWRPDQSSRF
jgi:hypothetical protein